MWRSLLCKLYASEVSRYAIRDQLPFMQPAPARAGVLRPRGGLPLPLGFLSIAVTVNCWPGARLWGLGFGIPAWIMGQSDLNKIRCGAMDPEGEDNTRGGMICGIIGTCLGALSVLIIAVILMLMAAAHA